LLLYSGGLYECRRITRPFRYLPRVISLICISFLTLAALGFLLKVSDNFSRVWLVFWAISSIALVSLFRILVPKIMRKLALNGQLARNIMVFGAGQQGAELVHRIQQSREPWFRQKFPTFRSMCYRVMRLTRFTPTKWVNCL
jgi:FlaA1/EpsC-like NDP-sugar epimerase